MWTYTEKESTKSFKFDIVTQFIFWKKFSQLVLYLLIESSSDWIIREILWIIELFQLAILKNVSKTHIMPSRFQCEIILSCLISVLCVPGY